MGKKLTFTLELDKRIKKIKNIDFVAYDVLPDDSEWTMLQLWENKIAPIIEGLDNREILPGIVWNPYSLDITSNEHIHCLKKTMEKILNEKFIDKKIKVKIKFI